ncbi:MAG TPA: phosphoribosylanthranilate isomerase [Candidatus Angelobacter sp.]
MKTWIKICGTTSVRDALASVEAGADALGLIFAPSKRRITMEKAREIIRALPSEVERIGVFLNESVDEVLRTVMELDLTGIQLHGDELPFELCSYLPKARREELRIIKTILVQEGFEVRLQAGMQAAAEVVDAWLLDSGTGSGRTFDWQGARKQLGAQQGQVIIAGGLTPDNVVQAIHTFLPWGVDVVSGVEYEPGHKDWNKLKAFVQAVREAEKQTWQARQQK